MNGGTYGCDNAILREGLVLGTHIREKVTNLECVY